MFIFMFLKNIAACKGQGVDGTRMNCLMIFNQSRRNTRSIMRHVTLAAINWTTLLVHHLLTHWGRDKMAAISQTTLSNHFSLMKMFEFRLRFVQMMAWRRQATSHYRDQWWLDYRRIYASLGLNELSQVIENSYEIYKWVAEIWLHMTVPG